MSSGWGCMREFVSWWVGLYEGVHELGVGGWGCMREFVS